jgi:putative hemolysin
MSIGLMALISAVAFLSASFFAGSETAIIASERIRLRHLAATGDRRARLLLDYIHNPQYFLSIVLVGTNLGMIGCTATFTAIMIELYGDSGASLATLILVPSLLVFQEILPKAVFLYYADKAALMSILPLKFFAVSLFPIIKFFSGASVFLARMFGVGKMDRKVTMTMEELLFHLQGSTDAGLISPQTMELAARASEMLNVTVADVMLPVEKVVMVEAGLRRSEYREILGRERFSRLPVYKGDRQHVVGFLSVRALLQARTPRQKEIPLEELYVVGADTPVVGVLGRMKSQGCHMAMVRDSRHRIIGMTTLEDILESLVGAIADEFH